MLTAWEAMEDETVEVACRQFLERLRLGGARHSELMVYGLHGVTAREVRTKALERLLARGHISASLGYRDMVYALTPSAPPPPTADDVIDDIGTQMLAQLARSSIPLREPWWRAKLTPVQKCILARAQMPSRDEWAREWALRRLLRDGRLVPVEGHIVHYAMPGQVFPPPAPREPLVDGKWTREQAALIDAVADMVMGLIPKTRVMEKTAAKDLRRGLKLSPAQIKLGRSMEGEHMRGGSDAIVHEELVGLALQALWTRGSIVERHGRLFTAADDAAQGTQP